MSKHISDRPRAAADKARTERFAEIERAQGGEPGRAAKALHRQERSDVPAETLKRFTAIERQGG